MPSQYNPSGEPALSKSNLRSKMRVVRKQFSADYRQDQSQMIARHLAPLLVSLPAQSIGMYLATALEVNLDPLIEICHQRGRKIYLPHLEDHQTPFHRFFSWESLESGPLDLRHPPKTAPAITTAALDVIILPGLAFDRLGNRLGHGGGWYDKALDVKGSHVNKPLLIGVCFDEQFVDAVPCETFDVRMDIVVTPYQLSIINEQ